MTALKYKRLSLLFLLCFMAAIENISTAHAANPMQNCALFLKKLFKSEPVKVLLPPEASRLYPEKANELLEMGELQRALWKKPALRHEIEDFLKSATLGEESKLSGGSTGAKKVNLHGIFRGKEIQIPAIQKAYGAENEVAYYELEKLFGLSLSPVTVEKVIQGKKNSFQLFLGDAASAEDLHRIKTGDHHSMTIDMMDYLTSNYDRRGNYLITLDEHRIVTMDAGLAFSTIRPASSKPYQFAGSLDESAKHFYQKLKQIPEEQLVNTLKTHLPEHAVQNVLTRRKLLIEFMEKTYPH